MPKGERPAPPTPSFDALASQMRQVAEARRAKRRGLTGARPELRERLRRVAETASALAESDAI